MRKSLLFLLFLLPFCAFATSITGIKADGDTKVFNLDEVVSIKDGTEVKYLATDIDSIRIDNFTAVPADQTELRFKYDESTMTAMVAGSENYNYDIKEVKIPSQVLYDGKVFDVTEIGDRAFNFCTSLTSIVIPNSVTAIDSMAFYECGSLTSIEIPNSVTKIDSMAFSGCRSLTSIVIPESVTEIGEGAFSRCTSLTSIVVNKDNKVYDSRENCNAIIETASNTLIKGCHNTVIPNSVTEIRYFAFKCCTNLTSIEIPNSVTTIGHYAFYNCESLTSIDIPESVTKIGDGAFSGCESLTSIEIPNSVTEIGEKAFHSCKSLTSIVIPNSVTKIGDWAFDGCSKLKTARVPVSLKGKIDSFTTFPETCEIEWY